MSGKINILMLGGAKRVSLAKIFKSAGERMGKGVEIFSYEIIPSVPIACVGTVLDGSRWGDADIYDKIAKVIKEKEINIILPFVDGAIEICSKLKEFHPEVFVPVSDFAVAHSMFDKGEAAAVFESHHFEIPKTYTPENCSFPAILKPRTGSASKGIVVVNNVAELEEVANKENYLIQEYIADREEYTVDCYVSPLTKEVVSIVPRIRISTTGGEVDRTETRRIPELISQSDRILRELNFEGPITIQFIHEKGNGRYLLMEINPRLGGGVICSILAGANIAEMILRESLGEAAQPVSDWRDRALMARYFSEVMFFNEEK